MKVYVVYQENGFGGSEVAEVFSSRGIAREYVIDEIFGKNQAYKNKTENVLNNCADQFIHEHDVLFNWRNQKHREMKNEIYYNDLRPSRFRVMPLGLAEQEEVIEAINYLLENDNGNINKKWLGLIQRFVDNYAKLEHHRAITEGLYAFDSDPRHLLEEFWQRSSDACPLTCTEAENEETAFAEWVKNKIITISY